jgi:hypothetical protein
MRRKIKSLLSVLSFFSLAILLSLYTLSQAKIPQDDVREVLQKFKQGIDQGDKTVGPQLTTGEYAPLIVSLYDSLVDGYKKFKIPFPMEIGHVKILKDGRAKAETYLNPGKNLFVFTLIKEAGSWKISHMENIRFPLYDIPALPYREVYQLPQDKRSSMMAERDMAFKSFIFAQLEKDHGKEFASNFFLDGPGFRVAMDAWLPFVEGAAQFALFYAIIESNYYGSKCLVTKATEEEAEIHLAPLRDLEILKVASFNPKIPTDEYKNLYARIMKDRAAACGLDIDVSFQDTGCILKLRKKS